MLKANDRQPQIGVGAIVVHQKKILLVKRKNPPGAGLWSIPGGKLKFGESLKQTAEREVFEETGIKIKAGDPVYTFEVIERDEQGLVRFHYVIIDLLAKYLSGTPQAADDAQDCGWFSKQELERIALSPYTKELIFNKKIINF